MSERRQEVKEMNSASYASVLGRKQMGRENENGVRDVDHGAKGTSNNERDRYAVVVKPMNDNDKRLSELIKEKVLKEVSIKVRKNV